MVEELKRGREKRAELKKTLVPRQCEPGSRLNKEVKKSESPGNWGWMRTRVPGTGESGMDK